VHAGRGVSALPPPLGIVRVLREELLFAGAGDSHHAMVLLPARCMRYWLELNARSKALDKRAELGATLFDEMEVDDGRCYLHACRSAC
jgi:hypothetical protein